jgi:hypothetical protein
MMAIWTANQTSVSQNQRYILNLDILERQRMAKLRDKLRPDGLSRITKLMVRFEKLGEKKRNDSMEQWLRECEELCRFPAYSSCCQFGPDAMDAI